MTQDLWTQVDEYLEERFLPADEALEAALAASVEAGLPAIQVAPNQGKFLHLLALVSGARRILEIGTLGGYSGIWFARALPPGGRVVTLEIDPKHAEVARRNFERAGVADRVEVRVGRALDLLPALEQEGAGPFDLIFIDADKPSNPEYFAWALKLSRPGTVVVVDNVVRAGGIVAGGEDENNVGVRRVLEMMGSEPRVTAAALQTVGVKGHDGFAVALVTR